MDIPDFESRLQAIEAQTGGYNFRKAAMKATIQDTGGCMHVTRDGRMITVFEMEDRHLINTIRFLGNQLANNIKSAMDFTKGRSMLTAMMTGRKKDREQDVDNARQLLSDGYLLIGKYLVEAIRRSLVNEAHEAMIEFYKIVNQLGSMDTDGNKLIADGGSR